ncbi:SWIM zinc finger family protein [Streptomyces sp. PCS3-D2]|uniref:SWIM zinc finger family protein n=1 Tax=Streptomyces sp. PCS3-D2 TaxID=1460244 RepID=UPI00272BC15E|nr:SWIM zinc finger family protein [Streptomyces sp. PCS3-D2]WKV70243.1 SWIM zinc finger family protein [Streptomyces sp. PCS3-D2]
MSTALPPVAPEVLAEAVENLTARLRKKLDDATAGCADAALRAADGSVAFRFGADALVTLRPGPSGTVTEAGQATCTCLLAPRCLHRAAALGAAPLADAVPPKPEPDTDAAVAGAGAVAAGAREAAPPAAGAAPTAEPVAALTPAQLGAAAALWHAAAEALAAGVTAGGAVVQAELLRAAHTARLAGLPRAEAAALRVVRGLRAARERHTAHRLGDLTGSFRELLHTAGVLASGTADPALTGTSRRAYTAGGSLRVHGLCREPVLSATGYGGVVTHLLAPDGSRYSISDVRPGGLARARGAARASVALGGATLDHAGLARGGLSIVGATVSAEGRLGAGRGVKATPLPGAAWADGPAAALFARPAAEAVAALLADPAQAADAETALIGCDVVVAGPAGDHLLVREARPDAPLLRLLPAHPHPELRHTENLRRIASYPGLRLRVLGRPDLGRAATLRPVAVGPVPGEPYTLRLPEEWLARADLGYDRLQGEHFPPPDAAGPAPEPGRVAAAGAPDPLADSPLWRVRRLLETGVAGGRRAVAEAARGTAPPAAYGPLRRAGLTGAADLAAALAAEADRRPRDAFGRLADPSSDGYAWAWLAAATHLAAAERSLVAASWTAAPTASRPAAP